jgi:hypothetical protein
MNGPTEYFIKAAAALIVAGGIIWMTRRGRGSSAAWVGGFLCVFSVAVYMNGWVGHGGGSFVQSWEQFHYRLGSRYFDELGYDGLYAASIAAYAAGRPDRRLPHLVRDLRNDRLVTLPQIKGHAREVRARFDEERWEAFKADHRIFERHIPARALRMVWVDHGHNATPTWSVMGRAVTALLPREPYTNAAAALLDVVLLTLAFLVVLEVYGSVCAAAVVAAFGVGHLWRFWWVGGAFLRFDWLCLLILTMACLHVRAWRRAGVLLALATVLKLFPGIFLLPLAVSAAGNWRRGQPTRWFGQFAAAYAVTLATGLLIGASTAHGWLAWGEFADRITRYESAFETNKVGLRTAIASIPASYQGLGPDTARVDPWKPWSDAMERASERRSWLFLLIAFAITFAASVRAFDSEPDMAMAAGVVLVYTWANPASYYGTLLLLLPLARGPTWAAAVAGLSAALHLMNGFVSVYPPVYSVASWLVVAMGVAFLWPLELPAFRGQVSSFEARPSLDS